MVFPWLFNQIEDRKQPYRHILYLGAYPHDLMLLFIHGEKRKRTQECSNLGCEGSDSKEAVCPGRQVRSCY